MKDQINNDPRKISWSSSLIPHLEKGNFAEYQPEAIVKAAYRPFTKEHLYFGDKLIHRRGQHPNFYTIPDHDNLLICTAGVGVTKDFSVQIPNQETDS